MDLWGLVEAVLGELGSPNFMVRVVAATVAAIVIALVPFALRWLWRRIKADWAWRERALVAEKKIEDAADAVDGNTMWLKQPVSAPKNYPLRMQASIPVLTLANLKGGVGKTTLAANLAAYFAIERNERVLAIDLDFQGSLTSMTLPDEYGRQPSRASQLVGGTGLNHFVAQPVVLPVQAYDGRGGGHINRGYLKAIDAYFDVSETETEAMVKWLLGREARDVRYFIAEALLDDSVQNNFDRVILDAPPRMTTSAIQAFCASTHVLIPTILDQLSGDAVASLCDRLARHWEIWPELKILGVVGVMTNANVGEGRSLAPQEREGMVAVREALARVRNEYSDNRIPDDLLPVATYIANKAEFSRFAGQRILYADAGNALALQETRRMIERLGAEVTKRM